MQLTPLGDGAIHISFTSKTDIAALEKATGIAQALAEALLPGVTDIVPAYATITVHYDPARVPVGAGSPSDRIMVLIEGAAAAARTRKNKGGRELVVPVCYGGDHGPDLAEVAKHAKLKEAEVIKLHSATTYRVAALGFSPGFPYLLGLPPKLHMPRRPTPRTEVPAGSVGIGSTQTGVYPLATPGGWSLIGRTSLRLFRPEEESLPTLLSPGDTVKFKPITEKEWNKEVAAPKATAFPKPSKQACVIEVLKPGVLTTVQDLGRPGWQNLGIPVGGAMDRRSARIANLLLGNAEDEPVLEAALIGPEIKFLRDTWIAVTGATVEGVAGWRPLKVTAGQILSLMRLVGGARVYLAVAGGFEIPRVLGGAGTLLRAAIGGVEGRALQTGDRLAARQSVMAGTTEGWSAAMEFRVSATDEISVRFVRGLQWDWFSAVSRQVFSTKSFRLTSRSDRMGLRLDGHVLKLKESRELVSEGVGFGSVQVPLDGHPIVLMADRQTLGGYPKIAHVISVDLPRLAQARAGVKINFVEVSLAEAQQLYLEEEHSIAVFRAGVEARLRR
ncbi:MAG TPA: 5-oxoprolinase subunit PxpB [Rariglobus sp.]|nr:5-oxoprolinase subunit PxpB [Rariglobus sp.]